MIPRVFPALLLLGLVAAGEEDVRPEYDRVLEAFKARRHEETVREGLAFLGRRPDYKFAHSALYMVANAQYALRRFEECIASCERYLREHPEKSYGEAMELKRAQALFKLRRAEEAAKAFDAFLIAHPEGKLAGPAREWRERIGSQAPQRRVLGGYAGKYEADPRLQAKAAEVERLIPVAVANARKRLGLEQATDPAFFVRFRDAGRSKNNNQMESREELLGGKVVQVLTIHTEYLLLGMYDLERTLTHEALHCWQRERLDEDYYEIPSWVREGLAVWTAGQGPERLGLIFNAEAVSPTGDPGAKLVNGLEGAHGLADYAEDYLAFAFLEETRGLAEVQKLARRLFESSDYRAAFAAAAGTGFEPFLENARAWTRRRIDAGLAGRDRYLEARRLYDARRDEEAAAAYEALLAANPQPWFAPRARRDLAYACFRLGRLDRARALIDECERIDAFHMTRDDVAFLRIEIAAREGGDVRPLCDAFRRDYSWAYDRYEERLDKILEGK